MQKKTIAFLLTSLWFASCGHTLEAQQRHELVRGDMPPGMAAQVYTMSDRSLVGHTQAVQLVVPEETVIEIGDGQGAFSGAKASRLSVAMDLGFVYRFRLSNLPLPRMAEKQLYPSIEVLGKLNPPAGLENEFPIQVVLTHSDLKLALNGQMVTRVIYLEDPRGPLPHRHQESAQPSLDVTSGQDPLRAAEKLGQPMAILRLGSRVPLQNDANHWFNFGVSTPQILPDPGQVGVGAETPVMKTTDAKTMNSSKRMKQVGGELQVDAPIEKVNGVARVEPIRVQEAAKRVRGIGQVGGQESATSFPAPSITEVEMKVAPLLDRATSSASKYSSLRKPNQL